MRESLVVWLERQGIELTALPQERRISGIGPWLQGGQLNGPFDEPEQGRFFDKQGICISPSPNNAVKRILEAKIHY